ncbi:MAG: glycosyltransferase family 2 protein [Kiritimatiellae bacterium]|nr:glycosyltransferase family 2 protein [Kiritimatiellia bacterium]
MSVIVPTFNRAKMVCDCVESALANGYPSLEVVVVDDCSPDDTGARVAARFGGDGRVKYLRNERNSFQAVSRNRGRRAAAGEYLFFLDDDNILQPGAVAELVRTFAGHPDAGLVAPMAVHRRPGAENLVWSLGSDFSRWTSRPKDRRPNLPLHELPPEPTLYPTTYYPNGFMVTAEAFDRTGGFDESLEQIFEESDFGWRIMEAGYRGFVSTAARTDHYGFIEPGCAPALRLLGIEKPRRTYCFARNRLRFARRHFNLAQILSVTLLFAPLSCVYYCSTALANRRPDIALAYLRGTAAGILGL